MANYVSLIQFTAKGAEAIRESPERAHAFNASASKAGVQVVDQYWTIGAYDGILVLRAEDESSILHFLTELVSRGFVKTETMKAFTDKEFEAILEL